jgi:hypothetical protein
MASSSNPVDQSKTDSTAAQKNESINKTIRKDVDKIVDKYDIEDVITQCNAAQNKTVSYCRCWKSKKVCKKRRACQESIF